MLPMIRLSELYYIQAEHLCRKGDISGAINKIDIVRDARNCQTGSSGQMYQKIKDLVSRNGKRSCKRFHARRTSILLLQTFKIISKE